MAPEKIREALQKLDVANDNHWLQDGLPRLETVRVFASDQSLTREAITAAAPEFTRLSAYNAQQAKLVSSNTSAAPPAATSQVDVPVQPAADPAPVVAPVAEATAEVQAEVQAEPVEELSPEKKELEAVQAELAELERDLQATLKRKKELHVKADDLIIRIDRGMRRNTNQEDIVKYLASQRQSLDRRAAKIKALEGVNIKDFLPSRSPIDTALARKSGYGQKRPGT